MLSKEIDRIMILYRELTDMADRHIWVDVNISPECSGHSIATFLTNETFNFTGAEKVCLCLWAETAHTRRYKHLLRA